MWDSFTLQAIHRRQAVLHWCQATLLFVLFETFGVYEAGARRTLVGVPDATTCGDTDPDPGEVEYQRCPNGVITCSSGVKSFLLPDQTLTWACGGTVFTNPFEHLLGGYDAVPCLGPERLGGTIDV